jgi:hypothetical protein
MLAQKKEGEGMGMGKEEKRGQEMRCTREKRERCTREGDDVAMASLVWARNEGTQGSGGVSTPAQEVWHIFPFLRYFLYFVLFVYRNSIPFFCCLTA